MHFLYDTNKNCSIQSEKKKCNAKHFFAFEFIMCFTRNRFSRLKCDYISFVAARLQKFVKKLNKFKWNNDWFFGFKVQIELKLYKIQHSFSIHRCSRPQSHLNANRLIPCLVFMAYFLLCLCCTMLLRMRFSLIWKLFYFWNISRGIMHI